MNTPKYVRLVLSALCSLCIHFVATTAQAEPAPSKPNIIFILIDDLGKEWVNCYGGEGVETPNVDALAASGMRFNNAYSMPQCTPSRACFITGQYPFRSGWVNHWDAPRWGGGYFDWTQNPSIARTMKAAGYATAVAGKWQLNDFRVQPDAMTQLGFDEYCMWTGYEGSPDKKHSKASSQRYWNPHIHTKEGSKTYQGAFGPDIYHQFLLDFITEHKEQPFFIYYPMALTHGPLVHTPLDMNVSSKVDKHKAMVRYADHLLGKLIAHLDNEGLRDHTLVIWTTDNGSSRTLTNTMNGRTVTGGKSRTTENGVNAPFIVNWPGIVAEGKVSEALVDFTDMHPTFADFACATPDEAYRYDGVSLKDVFLGKAKESQRKWILSMGGSPARMTDQGVQNVYTFRDRVVRDARYKLFISPNRTPEKLVDLSQDPEEAHNLIGNPEYEDVLKRLTAVIGQLPEMDNDPKYEPLPANPWDKKSSKQADVHKTGHPENARTKKK
jgi:arylsulfatase A-like enzyme